MKQIIDLKISTPVPVVMAAKGVDDKRDAWDAFERYSKVISIALIPVVLAVGGWFIQKQIQDQSIAKDYVQLAVSILKEPESAKISPEIRNWAARLLNDNSKTKLSDEALSQLSKGVIVLPGYTPSSRPVESLQPVVAVLARKLIEAAAAQGIEVKIIRTLVTSEEQNALYASGRTAPGPIITNAKGGKSKHNLGLAFDVAPVEEGKTEIDNVELYKKLGAIGKNLGLTWGGDFAFPDYPHFEYREKVEGNVSK
ncbi:M15 family metallopeptidase [Undibacterium sp. Ji83W]|uniref:M15 family metallopeptidase n=1 Tax=Undibacterium sp. Ji83W TaxID=3413043 RepID=UPI003BF42BF9